MQRFTLISAIIIIAIFGTGCAANDKTNEQVSKVEGVSSGTEIENVEVNAETVLVNQLFKTAVELKNKDLCNEIKDAVRNKECSDTVAALNLIDKASIEGDKSICDAIVLDSYKSLCEISAGVAADERAAQEGAEQKRTELLGKTQVAIDAGDVNACGQLEEPYDAMCEQTILTNEALAAVDVKLCEKIKTSDAADYCREIVQVAASR